jgi:hypothetical protein
VRATGIPTYVQRLKVGTRGDWHASPAAGMGRNSQVTSIGPGLDSLAFRASSRTPRDKTHAAQVPHLELDPRK